MSSRTGATSAMVVKWLIVPLALLVIGYFLIGPRIGAPGSREQAKSNVDPLAEDPSVRERRARTEPAVEVEATPVTRRRSRSQTRSKPREEPPAAPSEPGSGVQSDPPPSEATEPPPTA